MTKNNTCPDVTNFSRKTGHASTSPCRTLYTMKIGYLKARGGISGARPAKSCRTIKKTVFSPINLSLKIWIWNFIAGSRLTSFEPFLEKRSITIVSKSPEIACQRLRSHKAEVAAWALHVVV